MLNSEKPTLSRSPRKTVMICGTFDSVHPGHLDLISQARAFGDYLIVVVGRDANVKKIKGAYPKLSEHQRLKAIKKVKGVNQAVLGYLFNRYKIIKEWKPDVICLGYDQRQDIPELQTKLKEMNVIAEIHRLAPFQPDKYKSSIINNK